MRWVAWLACGALCGVMVALAGASCGFGGIGGDCSSNEGPLPSDGMYTASSHCSAGYVCSTGEVIRVSEQGALLVYTYARKGKPVRIEYRHLRGVAFDLGAGDQ